jgi:ATP-binding cassette, subfamily G (WHITE), member 2
MNITGDVRINGKPYVKNLLKSMSGYVMQDDLVHAQLTVQETLMYTAALRLPNTADLAERQRRCDESLKTMGIEYCRDVIVGDTRNKGISGGERKRLCVAMELITRPKLLFLDEPTSGLDSTTALSLMHTMKDLCEKGMCTVVCTIHQPQTKIFNLIDNLLLMKKGEIVYQGSCAKAELYFAQAGYPCPDKMNPADHMLDCVTMGTHDEKEQANIPKLAVPLNMDFGLEMNDFSIRAVQPWVWQYAVLVHRNMMEKLRRWDIIAMNIFITIIVAVFISNGAWFMMGNYADSVPKRNALMFFTVIHQGVVSSLQGTYAFPLERAIMLRERAAGAYYVSAYFLAKTTVDSFFQLLAPFVFTAFVYPIAGLNLFDYQKPFIFLGFQMLLCNCAVALSNMCSCLFVSIEMSTVILACAMEITRLYSAFFVSPVLLDSYPKWKVSTSQPSSHTACSDVPNIANTILSHHCCLITSSTVYFSLQFFDQISYMKYGYIGLCVNEYNNLKLQCTPAQLNKGVCVYTSGDQLTAQYGYNRYTVGYCAGMMIVYIAVCRITSYLGLRFIKV